MPVDLFSVTQDNNRFFSFFTQCIGLMSELDLWTEHLRFMGSSRFQYGFLRGLIKFRSCPAKVQIKVVNSDKAALLNMLSSSKQSPPNSQVSELRDVSRPSTLPPLKHSSHNPEEEGWITFDKPILYLYAGKGPYVGVDLMQFPVSLPSDGCIDITIQERTTRNVMLQAIEGGPRGEGFWMPSQHYFKAEAYRVEPLSSNSCLAVDGEAYPFEPFEVEVHKGLATWLSPYGHYKVNFDPNDPKLKKK